MNFGNNWFFTVKILLHIYGEFATGLNLYITPPLGRAGITCYSGRVRFPPRDEDLDLVILGIIPVSGTQFLIDVLRMRWWKIKKSRACSPFQVLCTLHILFLFRPSRPVAHLFYQETVVHLLCKAIWSSRIGRNFPADQETTLPFQDLWQECWTQTLQRESRFPAANTVVKS